MRMFNADGSEGKMCGNGIRCVGRLAYDTGLCRSETIKVETLSGIKTLRLDVQGRAKSPEVTVDMGAPVLERATEYR
jgi:diaminopimelate epimerase